MSSISISDFYKPYTDHIRELLNLKKNMTAGSLTGMQTTDRSDLSAAPLKKEKTDKKSKNVAVPTLDDYPARIRKCFIEYDMQKSGMKTTMREFYAGKLKDSHGNKVVSKKQAQAIGYNS